MITERDAAQKSETDELHRLVANLQASLPDVYHAAELVRTVHSKVIWSAVGVTAVATVIAMLVLRFFFHVY